jgi:hypothetical protein
MKNRITSIILLGSIIGSVFAQKIELKGLVREAKTNEVLAFVNVVLQTPDSAFVTGAVSDDNGRFAIPNVKPGDYRLAFFYMGYITQYIEVAGLAKSLTLPDILMEDGYVGLDVVTVTASATTSRIDRKLIFPTERQIRASINGFDLLNQLMLPRLQVNPMSNEVAVPGGGEVQLRINGVEVGKEEIVALLPADIIRVEFHDNPGLRYGNAEVVIDYIVRRHETGGTVSINTKNAFHLKKWGNHDISGKVNHKKSEFSAYYYSGQRNYNQTWRDNEETFTLTDGSLLQRKEEGTPGCYRQYYQGLNTAYSYMNDKRMVNITIRTFNNDPRYDFRGTIYNVAHSEDKLQMTDLTEDLYSRITPDLYYQENLKNGQTLILNLIGSYNYTDNSRTYQESRNGLLQTDVLNHVIGNKYSWIGEGIYEKKIGDNRLNTGLRHSQVFSDNTYRDNRTYSIKIRQSETYFYGEWKGRIKKLDYMLGAGVTRSSLWQENERESDETWNFNPHLTLFHPLTGNSSIRLKGSINNQMPSLANLNAVEQVIDSFQILRGNPSLKPYLRYLSDLNYEWRKGIFYVSLQLGYEYLPSAIMEEKSWEKNRIVWTWNNQNNWQRLSTSVFLRIGPVKEILQFSINGGFNRYISHGNSYRHVYNHPYLNAQLSAMYKNFSADGMWIVSPNRFYGETMEGRENVHILLLYYKYKQISFGLGMVNPFIGNVYVATENRSATASYRKKTYNNDYSRVAVFTFTYNFSFGRKYQSSQQRLNNTDEDAGVMKVEK